MGSKRRSIQNKLMRTIMFVSGVVVLMTCLAFFIYEYYSFREITLQKISTYGEIISRNSTAALAFDNKEDAEEILNALKAEPHIIQAAIYNSSGKILCSYPSGIDPGKLPAKPESTGYHFSSFTLEGFQPITENNRQLGTLFLRSDLKAVSDRFGLYGIIVTVILLLAFLLSFFLSRFLQTSISKPILSLEKTARSISEHKDYSVRATKADNDEVGSLTDTFNFMLTQIQEQTKELNDFNQNLEQKVKERTSELEAINKELGSFSYSVSHDLRAPVRSINGYMNIFMEDYAAQLDDEGKRLVNLVLKSGERMGLLIDDLLAFSQLGRKELIKTDFSMNELVSGVWNDLSAAEKDRKIEFNLGKLPDAHAEKSTMRQVWINLLSNALKYSKNKSQIVIEISAVKNKEETIYCVKDNGSGFDMRYYNKLFGVFQRLHSQEEFEGTGVGLAIVERIIKKHGGRIWAESEVDKGAAFYFSLPTVTRSQ